MSILDILLIGQIWSWFSFGVGVLLTLVLLAVAAGVTTCLQDRPAPEDLTSLADELQAPKAPRLGMPRLITYQRDDYEEALCCGEAVCRRILHSGDEVVLVPFGDEEILFCLACAPAGVVT